MIRLYLSWHQAYCTMCQTISHHREVRIEEGSKQRTQTRCEACFKTVKMETDTAQVAVSQTEAKTAHAVA